MTGAGGLPSRSAHRLILGAHLRRPVSLGTDRASAGDDDVGQPAQQPQHLLVGGIAEPAARPSTVAAPSALATMFARSQVPSGY